MAADKPDTDKPDECEACGFETEDLKWYRYSVPPRNSDVTGHWLCEVCDSTLMGSAHQYPLHYEGQWAAMQMTAYCTNLILQELRKRAP